MMSAHGRQGAARSIAIGARERRSLLGNGEVGLSVVHNICEELRQVDPRELGRVRFPGEPFVGPLPVSFESWSFGGPRDSERRAS
jgi:hypothetical protein